MMMYEYTENEKERGHEDDERIQIIRGNARYGIDAS